MIKKTFILLFVSFFLFSLANSISADTPVGNTDTPVGGSDTSLPNPLGESDPRVVIGMGIKALLSVLGSVALAVFIYGGFLWLTAGGNEQRIQKGKDVLIWATLGLMVVFAAYAIVGFFLGGQFLAIFFI